jgi:CubicO group peptidase (beta-lactamase class C family)
MSMAPSLLHAALGALLLCAAASGEETYPAPQFADPARVSELKSAFPQIDQIFRDYAAEKHIPGMTWGIVIDGELIHTGFSGVRDLQSRAPLGNDTAFRIASMTKSFTVLAILKLRDEGRLSLEDPVSKWIPEFAHSELPTRDSAPIRIRQLLSHSAGLPEDNPWGDQQLAASEDDLTAWLKRGFPFSTPPSTRYEYSNLAFGLLGRIVSKASGVPYERYVKTQILSKLRMDASTFRYAEVPVGRRAIGYRLQPDGTFREEPPLPQGAFGSAGGLLTTTTDLGRYIAFHLDAWPPRNDVDTGPVKRSSVREMSFMATPANLTVGRGAGHLQASQTGYGFGLRVTSDCRFEHMVGHGGGLPGFGSYMQWLPDYGVGLFAMATLTYSGPSEAINHAWDAMLKSGGLQRRQLPASKPLIEARAGIWELWNRWDDAKAHDLGAMNLLIDYPAAQRRAEIENLKATLGACTDAGPVIAENWLRGQFNIHCSAGTVGAFYTLSPTEPPRLQHLSFHKLESESTRIGAPTGAPAGVACENEAR